MQFNTTLRNARLDQIATTIGSSSAVIKFYTGPPPGVGSSFTGTLLSTLSAIVWASSSSGVKTFTVTADSAAAASGTPGYARFVTSSGGTVTIETVAAIGSGDFNFSGSITSAGTVTLSSGQFTEGNP